MVTISVNMVETAAIAVFVILIGSVLKHKLKFLERFCIPVPVIGGLLFALFALVGNLTKTFSFQFDHTLQHFFMTAFFTTIGYSASLKSIKKGSRTLIILTCVVAILCIVQNAIALGFSGMFDMHPLLALCTGSISMVGGHGTAAAFGEIIEKTGIAEAGNVALVAATFGLAVGGLIGSPIAKRLIDKKNLLSTAHNSDSAILEDPEIKINKFNVDELTFAAFQILIAMGIGSLLSTLLEQTGLLFPSYVGALVVAVIIRNIADLSKKGKIQSAAIDAIGNVSLLLFISMALMSLRLWELADLALPMFAMLMLQTVFMISFAYFFVFRALGKDYDSAVITAGVCGFGMGATPNAMANMNALVKHYSRPSAKAFLVVPIVGGMFIDIFNSLVIIICINIFK